MNELRSYLGMGMMGGALLLSGCVAHDIGYAEVQSAVNERTGHRARWNYAESSDAGDPLVQKLLRRPLTAEAAAQIALLNNPEVQVAFEELGVSRAALMQAFRLPNPTAEAALLFGPGEDSPEIDLGVMLDLTELVTLPWSKQAAESSLEAAQARVVGELMDVVLATKRSFFEYQAALERLELRRAVVQASGASLALAQELREAGNISELALSIEQARYDEARLELARTEAAHTSARERLNQRLGLWGHKTHWRAAELPRLDPASENLDNVEQRALEASLELKLTEHAYAAAARRANLATVRGILPELKAGVAVERQEQEWSVGPAVELELPIFYQGQGEVELARAEMRRERSRHAGLAVRVRSAVRTAARNLVTARDAVTFYRDHLLPERERIVEQTLLQYNAMSVGAFELLQARRDQVQAASAYVDALRDYWIARAELEQLLAGRLVEVAPLREPAAASAASNSVGH